MSYTDDDVRAEAANGEGSYSRRHLANGTAKAVESRSKRGKAKCLPHPATGERDYSSAESEVLRAITEYKARTGRRFLAHSEIFHIIVSLGYEKPGGQPTPIALAAR